jgi:hypothetical protein
MNSLEFIMLENLIKKGIANKYEFTLYKELMDKHQENLDRNEGYISRLAERVSKTLIQPHLNEQGLIVAQNTHNLSEEK